MNQTIRRPVFYEGQILGSADLNAAVKHSDARQARHERYLHTWGIAAGLDLQDTERQTTGEEKYKEITVTPGVAIDGSGRQIVITEPQRLSETAFYESKVLIADDPDAEYPVFLVGHDTEAPRPRIHAGNCQSSEPTRIAEGFDIEFGFPGSAVDLDKPRTVDVSEGPGGTIGTKPWRILLGFVKWDANIDGGRFTSVPEESTRAGRRYAGVRADEVAARSGRLALRSRMRNENGKPAVIIDDNNGGEMHFGLQDSTGTVKPVFTVNAKGDVRARGKIVGALAGGVQVESGVVADGMLVPLPTGITQEKVNDGEVLLQIQVTPRYQELNLKPAPLSPVRWLMSPIECRTEGRRVFCRMRWAWSDGTNPKDLPGACDYIIMAFSAAE